MSSEMSKNFFFSPAGIFEVLASQHVTEENVQEMPLGQELNLNVESHMESAERALAFCVSVSNRSSRLNTPGSLLGHGETPRGASSVGETEGSYPPKRLCPYVKVSLLLKR